VCQVVFTGLLQATIQPKVRHTLSNDLLQCGLAAAAEATLVQVVLKTLLEGVGGWGWGGVGVGVGGGVGGGGDTQPAAGVFVEKESWEWATHATGNRVSVVLYGTVGRGLQTARVLTQQGKSSPLSRRGGVWGFDWWHGVVACCSCAYRRVAADTPEAAQ